MDSQCENRNCYLQHEATVLVLDRALKVQEHLTRELGARVSQDVKRVSTEPDRWKRYLAQRFGKEKRSVTPEDWKKANGWKIPSVVWVSLDAGLRPVEVERAAVSWVDIQNGMLRIPKEDSSKNRDNWYVGLTERTADSLRRWLKERENYEMYRETDSLWLTRERNPYQSQPLRYLLKRLCDIAA